MKNLICLVVLLSIMGSIEGMDPKDPIVRTVECTVNALYQVSCPSK